MIPWLVITLRDLRWWWLARRAALGHLDGMIQGQPVGELGMMELVVPRWWALRRWLAWLRAPLRVESNFGRRGGGFVFAVVRARPWAPRKPIGIRLPSGRTIVPR
jgi:hypothetical protein